MKTPENKQLQLAFDFVQYTGNNIFLTGKAGTGKTTFLHNLKKLSPKRMVVVAPTGVAAINAGGVTIHSFFQLSFGPQVPGYEESGAGAAFKRFSKEKINIMKSLDLLVIDEISMVRADLLDGIDRVLRRFKNRTLPFGGVQLLMIGDLQQLAPVVKEDEWQILRQHYETAFFFSSQALKQTSFTSIELKHVYRQSDQHFIDLLNKIRDNKMDQGVIDVLNTRHKPGFKPDGEGFITLTTHNAKARNINESRLKRLQGQQETFIAEVQGKFPEYNYPTDESLVLKEGAQVMFVKNDPSPDKEYYNGKIGKVRGFDEGSVIVKCPEDEFTIRVNPVEWQNVKYGLNRETKEITEEVEGSFSQIPLKLAWAITIHKSQGLTFEKAIIDAEAAFAHGQVYVALSRCKSLEGLVLSSRIGSGSLRTNTSIQHFTSNVEQNQPDRNQLEAYKMRYHEKMLMDLFDFSDLQNQFYHVNNLLSKNAFNLPVKLLDQYEKSSRTSNKTISKVAGSFQHEIRDLLEQEKDAEKNGKLQQRLNKAVLYFNDQLEQNVISLVNTTAIETDNREIKKSISEALDKLYERAAFKQKCLAGCKNGFVLKEYLQTRAKASIEDLPARRKRKQKVPDTDEIKDAKLYELLKSWRNAKADELNWEVFMVLPLKTIRALCASIPSNKKTLREVKGFGKKKLETFGDELLDLLIQYRRDHNMEVLPPEDPLEKTRKPKINTKQISYDLWKQGKNIEDVAAERNMSPRTIEGHLAHFIETGELEVHAFVDDDKFNLIKDHFLQSESLLLNDAKEALGNDVSFRELKFVKSYMIHLGKIN
ncbi:MAG: helix-turn-helix domain-containing protein [Bacteroidales bacterium]|nr:helix-turn-helix domain-containing protein [Bacteroidales bacterium]MCF8387897.1 helix-turn-helix domain-containing protein [Bacteroidales bacterium]MCF8399420.1 helix-turn-helix domain-containing protein [Bacteroidales bacterium]